jgi:DNA-binding beta-propeller fold protein YncE
MSVILPAKGALNWDVTLNAALTYLDNNSLKVSTRPAIVANNAEPITVALSDSGTLIRVDTDENNYWQEFKIPTNAVVAFPIGTVITFATVNATIVCTELYDEASDTRSNIYGDGRGTSTNWMGFYGTGICRLTKIGTDDWILSGPSIFQD